MSSCQFFLVGESSRCVTAPHALSVGGEERSTAEDEIPVRFTGNCSLGVGTEKQRQA